MSINFLKSTYFLRGIGFAVILALLVLFGLIPTVTSLLVLTLIVVLAAYQNNINKNNPIFCGALWLIAIVLGVTVGLYRPADFNYPILFKAGPLYEGGLPFALHINIGVACAGYCILFFLLQSQSNQKIFVVDPKKQYGLSICMAMLVLVAAYYALGLEWHIKGWTYIAYFAVANLFVTCVAEEAFMRLLLQAQLQKFILRSVSSVLISELLALFIATVLFVLTHFTPTLEITLVYALAGLSYGLMYMLTKNIWASITVHFLVNMIHFALLTYPLK